MLLRSLNWAGNLGWHPNAPKRVLEQGPLPEARGWERDPAMLRLVSRNVIGPEVTEELPLVRTANWL